MEIKTFILILIIASFISKTYCQAALPNANTTTEYNAQVLSTNFTIPIIRFNFLMKDSGNAQNKNGNVSFFNSIGAGAGYYWGPLTEITDASGKVINTEMDNTFGIQGGFLFAANASSSNNINIFVLTLGVSIFNFEMAITVTKLIVLLY